MRVTAVIPCHNEAQAIAEVITKTLPHVDRVVVVDNLSTDLTMHTALNVERQGRRVDVIQCHRKGAGAATQEGMRVALEVAGGYVADVVVTLDGDGQHDPDDIPKLLFPMFHDCADVVIGSRFLRDFEVARYRKFGIDVITWLYNVGAREKVVDGLSCFRAFSRKAAVSIKVTERGFGFSTEVLVKARAKHLRIVEVPVRCIYHDEFRQNSTSNPVTMGIDIALRTVKWRVREEVFA